jgi:ankyrin repeat protein
VNVKASAGDTALIMASSKAMSDVCLKLIEAKADVNVKDDNGLTSMSCAIRKNLLKVVSAIEAVQKL